jgi:hypothetical protein
MRYTLVLAFLFACGAVHAEKSDQSTGQISIDLGTVYGALEGIKHIRDICSDDFPKLRTENENAYTLWRQKYLPFLQEIERHWSAFAETQTNGGEPKKLYEFRVAVGDQMNKIKASQRDHMIRSGHEQFERVCQAYPRYLKTDRANLEYFYSEQVETIRRALKSE